LLGIVAAGLAPNLWWLSDWTRYWFLRHTSLLDNLALPTWQAVLGSPRDYLDLAGSPRGMVLAAAGVGGLIAMWRSGHRCGTALLLTSSILALATTRLLAAGLQVPDAVERLTLFAASLLAAPAAFAFWKLLERGRCAGFGSVAAVMALVAIALGDGQGRPITQGLGLRIEPL